MLITDKNMDKVYSLKRKKDTQELHLFEGEMTEPGKCLPDSTSVCREMTRTESVENIFSCSPVNEARTECAAIGRPVCGTCVSHLYTTYH